MKRESNPSRRAESLGIYGCAAAARHLGMVGQIIGWSTALLAAHTVRNRYNSQVSSFFIRPWSPNTHSAGATDAELHENHSRPLVLGRSLLFVWIFCMEDISVRLSLQQRRYDMMGWLFFMLDENSNIKSKRCYQFSILIHISVFALISEGKIIS